MVAVLVAAPLLLMSYVMQAVDTANPPESASMLTATAVVFALTAIVALIVVPNHLTTVARRSILKGTWPAPTGRGMAEFVQRTGDAGRMAVVWIMRAIVSAAILEGAALLAFTAYLLEQSWLPLVLGGAMTSIIYWQIPTEPRVTRWTRDQLVLLDEERQLGPCA